MPGEEVRLSVPDRAVPILTRIAELSDDQVQRVLDGLTAGPAPASIAELRARLAAELDEDDVVSLVRQIFSLASLQGAHGYQAADVANAVADAQELQLTDEQRERLRRLISEGLEAVSTTTLGKATDLFQEQGVLLHTARVVSDLRPLFAEPPARPEGAVILHRLRLSVLDDGEYRVVEVGLSRDDLDVISTAISRAQQKQIELEDFLRVAGIPLYDPAVL